MSRLMDHWEIKVIALLLAVVLYYFTGSLIRVEKTLDVELHPEQVVGLPDLHRVREIIPRHITVELNGPMRVLADLDSDDIAATLSYDPRKAVQGQQYFAVNARMLQLDPQLRLSFASPERVRVVVDRIVEAALPIAVAPQSFELGMSGLVVRQVRLNRAQVLVTGPERVIEDLREIGPLSPRRVRLDGIPADLTDPTELSVPLHFDLEDVQLVEDQRVMAQVTVAPAPGEMPVTLPLHVIADPDFNSKYSVELHQPEVAITITGPRNRLRDLDPEEHFLAYVDLTGKPTLDITQSLPVQVLTPPWASAPSTTARVTVRLQGEAGGGVRPGPRPEDQIGEPAPPPPR